MKNKTKYMWAIFATGLLFFSGCARTTPPVSIPPPPVKTESVVPPMKELNKSIEKTIEQNIKLEGKLKEQQKVVSEQKIAIVEAITQAKRIQEKALAKEAITQIETMDLITSLESVQTGNLFLETTNQDLIKDNETLGTQLKESRERSQDTLLKLIKKESECFELTTQNDFFRSELGTKNKENEQLKKQLSDEKIKSSNYAVYKKWIIWGVVGFVAWTILKNVLMIYLPNVKFRI